MISAILGSMGWLGFWASVVLLQVEPCTPQLESGQEWTYRGEVRETILPVDSLEPVTRTYLIDIHAFVLESRPKPLIAIQTRWRLQQEHVQETIPVAVALDWVEPQADGWQGIASMGARVDPVNEIGMLVAIPDGTIEVGKRWVTAAGKPNQTTWQVEASEIFKGNRCYRIVSQQQQPAMTQRMWLSPVSGLPIRVERSIGRVKIAYEWQSRVQLPSQLAADRRQEIAQAQLLQQDLTASTRLSSQDLPRIYESLLDRTDRYLERASVTPYRESILAMRRRLELLRRGDSALMVPATQRPAAGATAAPMPVAAPAKALAVGDVAPDGEIRMLTGKGETFRLSQFRKQWVVLAYVHPESRSIDDLLRSCETIQSRFGERGIVLMLSVDANSAAMVTRAQRLRSRIPLMDGRRLNEQHRMATTPTMLILNPTGKVEAVVEGWGAESMSVVERCLESVWMR
ncbi:peroxiredoxin family protein [Tuwongella immobilis]|uniref:Thioredoxin domain-containing protein n=1 Tax=Tuwongella immobilis TaxID=692036 RepID=A0A6C2YN61_9BACT|nr:hypothetical protein [Tuwongella immobilis]VIP02721.1 unnamed protein product [Tuwongella immobilis]VTS02254.1 unnamed protein product [Tuwongella immobilis]